MGSFQVSFPGLAKNEIPKGATLLLVGPSGVGKTTFGLQFATEGLMLGERAVYISLDNTFYDLISNAKKLGFEVDRFITADDLRFLDFFTSKPENINAVSIAYHRVVGDFIPKPTRIVLDSLSTLGMFTSIDRLPPWVLEQRARLKQLNVLMLLVLDTGIHPPSLSLALQNITDGTLEMKLEEMPNGELKRFFRIYSIRGMPHSTRWIPFEIATGGIKYSTNITNANISK